MHSPTHQPEVLFFSAPHCSQCKAVRPEANDVAASFAEAVDFTEIDTSSDLTSTKRHHVRGVPTLIGLHEGQEVGRIVGTATRDQLEELFSATIAGEPHRPRIAPGERALRLGTGVSLGVVALVSATPVLWIPALAATAFAFWDLLPARSRT